MDRLLDCFHRYSERSLSDLKINQLMIQIGTQFAKENIWSECKYVSKI